MHLTPDRCIHDVIAAQVRRTPDAPALVDDNTTLTYADLDRRANRLAAELRARGVGPDVLVGVLMERRAEYVIACLAGLKAGGAFLVLELAYPPALLAEVLADADPPVVVTVAAHADRVDAGRERIVLDVDDPPATSPTRDPHAETAPTHDQLDEGRRQPARGGVAVVPVAVGDQRPGARRPGRMQRLLHLGDAAPAAARRHRRRHR
jgi:non-ribosomal peptide synthetase component F